MEPRGNEDQPRSSRFDANRASSAHAGFGPSPYESQQALTPSARAIFSSVSARGMRFPISVSVIADDATPAAAASARIVRSECFLASLRREAMPLAPGARLDTERTTMAFLALLLLPFR